MQKDKSYQQHKKNGFMTVGLYKLSGKTTEINYVTQGKVIQSSCLLSYELTSFTRH